MTAFRVALVGVLVLLAGVAGACVLVLRGGGTPDLPPMAVETIAANPDIALPQRLDVESTAEGCRGYSVRIPTARVMGTPGSNARALMLDANDSALLLTCMNTTSTTGDLESFVAEKIAHPTGSIRTLPTATEVHSPYGRAIRTESVVGAKTLTEWFTERDGMTWGVGYLHPADDASQQPTVEAVLASWSWS
ncbi:hypothetical protein [Cellulomonas sp. PhB150]|uniref:hypothetical protein n=1 Tax=Cellulomonas sp. PhB150 TaxID=2485188 RepID=UPI000F475D99|nr:hypothetical protein [Cellulomonas sp. PhB150]ROS27777.1 hypothetical protein EDF34_1565 [Cellulomonas sp. PhB150]